MVMAVPLYVPLNKNGTAGEVLKLVKTFADFYQSLLQLVSV